MSDMQEEPALNRRRFVTGAAGLTVGAAALSTLAPTLSAPAAQAAAAARFRLNIGGDVTVWTECSDIGIDVDINDTWQLEAIRPRTTTLRRPLTAPHAPILEWFRAVRAAFQDGGAEAIEGQLKDLRITMINDSNKVAFRYQLSGCWPLRYGPAPKQSESDVAEEVLALVPRRMSRLI